MKRNKGFTLIELLVVIAIIGILSAIVLASLNQARSKANDARIQSQLANMRGAAEIYYGTSHTGGINNYGTGTTDCKSYLFGDPASGMGTLASSTPGIICSSADDAWAAAAPLVSTPSIYWCVDSTGTSHQVAASNFGTPPTAFPSSDPTKCPPTS